MRVCDYICSRLAQFGIRDVFIVTGGGAMFLNDAIGRQSGFRTVPMHHEQAAAIAAEAYGRYSGRPALLNVTTGPGGINAINGVFGAHTDSVPMIVVSGQVKRETMVSSYDLPLRQLGDQEVDIVAMVRGVTKYAVALMDPKDVRKVVERAFYLATSGRPGPVWIDVPIDVQSAVIDPESLEGFNPETDVSTADERLSRITPAGLEAAVADILRRLTQAKRPVIFGGGGIRASGQYDAFLRVIDALGVPTVAGWNAHDILPNAHPLYAGRPGSVGDRAGNFTVQNSDFLLVLGSRLNIRQISYNWQCFARDAFKVMVDVDAAELQKPTLNIDLPICADLNDFFREFERQLPSFQKVQDHLVYLAWCKEKVARYPVLQEDYKETRSPINPYVFVDDLFKNLSDEDTIVTGDGTACVVTFQGAVLKQGQRMFTNSGCASMGYDVPAAIGACFAGGADKTGRLICLAGDGSIMMNIQDLATISGWNLPIKIFILNNDGYHSIRQTQQNHFPGNIVGCGPDSGLHFPDFIAVARAFGIPGSRCDSHQALELTINEALASTGPYVCEIMIDKAQQFAPKVSSRRLDDGRMVSAPLEDLAPFLSREELRANMIIPVMES